MQYHPTRRSVLASLLALPPAIALRAQAETPHLALTPACGDETALTPSQTAGPFYTPNAPLKQDLSADAPGGRGLILAGFVLDRDCLPRPGALVEIWHADQHGEYDNQGHRLRGHQLTDAQGRWGFSTIETQHYSFRTAHYHFRVARPDGSLLTTQLYFPNHPRNATDHLFDPRLVLDISLHEGQRVGRFDFVV
ncbi:intradiol ring-cleavage dioxygenase [Brucellaceae bacterium D45D]